MGQSLVEMAATTAAIGMGVVFTALFLLSVYMHYFKVFIGRIDKQPQAPAAAKKAAPSPKLTPAPDASAVGGQEAARVAAAIAVGLRLEQGGGASEEEAAAIAMALACHRAKLRAGLRSGAAGSSWKQAGRTEAMFARVRRQERT